MLTVSSAPAAVGISWAFSSRRLSVRREISSSISTHSPLGEVEIGGDQGGGAEEWPPEKLHQVKAEHEDWVRASLSEGRIYAPQPFGADLVKSRLAALEADSDHPWCYVAYSPLTLEDDLIDPFQDELRRTITEHQFPRYLAYALGAQINPHGIEPSEHGLIAEDARKLGDGVAVRLEVYRTGHLDYAVCIKELLERISVADLLAQRPFRGPQGLSSLRREALTRVLLFDRWIQVLQSQFYLLATLRDVVDLQAPHLLVTASLTSISGATLLTQGPHSQVGRPAGSSPISFQSVFSLSEIPHAALRISAERLVNSFGLVLSGAVSSDDAEAWQASRL